MRTQIALGCLFGLALALSSPGAAAPGTNTQTTPHRQQEHNPMFDDPGWQASLLGSLDPMKSRVATTFGLNQEGVPAEARRALVKAFPTFYPYEQMMLLRDPLWSRVKCAEFIPLLELSLKLPETPEQANDWTYLDFAVKRLNELGSSPARDFLMEDLKRPKPFLSLQALLCLPEKDLPELDGAFSRDLGSSTDAMEAFKKAPAIARYGSAALLPEVKTLYLEHEGSWACAVQTAFLQHWIKHEPKEGIAALVRAVNLRAATGCYRTAISSTASRVYSPELETAILPFLNDTNIDVVMDAAQTIARHGTSDGRKRIIQLLDRYKPGEVIKSSSGLGEWQPRMNLIGDLSYSRRPIPDESELAPLKPSLTPEEWSEMLRLVAIRKQIRAEQD